MIWKLKNALIDHKRVGVLLKILFLLRRREMDESIHPIGLFYVTLG